MLPDEITFYKIEDYLRGRMSAAERAAFESEMAGDAELATLVRRQQQENQALEVLAERHLRVRMNTWERQRPVTMTPAGGRYRRLDWMRWAVAAMLVLAAGWWFLQPREKPGEAPIAVQPETPVTKPPTTTVPKTKPKTTPARPERRSNPTGKSPQDVIVEAPKTSTPPPVKPPAKPPTDYASLADEFYREGDFLSGRQARGSGVGKSLVVKELLAHSLLKSRKYDAAVTAFQEIARSGKQPYADRADWALALTYLHQMPRRSGALNQVLQNITARPGHTFNAKAKALQARLQQ